jgi:uncharacterized membrane protein YjjP (DUF1212 family)
MRNQSLHESSELGNLLLWAGTALLKAGAGSNRVVMNVARIADAYGYEANIDLSTRNITVSLHCKDQPNVFSGSRSIPNLPGVNFKVLTAISQLSWAVTDKKMSLSETADQLKKATQLAEYPRYIVLILTGVAGGAFCFTFGGHAVEMGITFLATFAGLFLKQELIRKKFNPYLVTYCSAFFAALIIGISWKMDLGNRLDHAFATCILFLIPGVPLINAVIDLMDGYIINGIDRGINAVMHAFSIAAGLATILYLFNVQ